MLKGLTVWYLLHRSYKAQSGDFVLHYAAAGGVGLITLGLAVLTTTTVLGGDDLTSVAVAPAEADPGRFLPLAEQAPGSETGAEIPVTSPRSGARTVLTDADGRAVRSRLDGDLLRDMALATGGAVSVIVGVTSASNPAIAAWKFKHSNQRKIREYFFSCFSRFVLRG